MQTKKLLYGLGILAAILVVTLVSCATPTPQVIEKIVTEIVKETVIVEGTPVEVTREVEKVVEVVVTATPEALVGPMKAVPRNRTLVLGGWEFTANLNASDNFNPIMNVASLRTNYSKFVYEALFYANLNTGEEYPWLAESYEVDDDAMGMDIFLRKGVEWADGTPFTCADVKYTIETQRDIPTAQGQHGYFMQWVESVECVDDYTVRINYTGANPRFYQHIMVGWENHFVIVPKHIFEGKDVATFTSLDLGKGLPMGTGAYKVMLVTPQQIVYDRRDDWWGAKVGFRDLPVPERIIVTTAAGDEILAQQYMANQIDYGGFALQVGSFEAAREKNPAMRSQEHVF
jgi:peptide/nickel transport system substrate-binding protein